MSVRIRQYQKTQEVDFSKSLHFDIFCSFRCSEHFVKIFCQNSHPFQFYWDLKSQKITNWATVVFWSETVIELSLKQCLWLINLKIYITFYKKIKKNSIYRTPKSKNHCSKPGFQSSRQSLDHFWGSITPDLVSFN